jgi:hypothetical protein
MKKEEDQQSRRVLLYSASRPVNDNSFSYTSRGARTIGSSYSQLDSKCERHYDITVQRYFETLRCIGIGDDSAGGNILTTGR